MRPSAKAFFIAFGLYIALAAALWQVEFNLPKQESKRISLSSINILKPKCGCQKCTCKSHIHPKQASIKPPVPPKKSPAKVQKPKKKLPKPKKRVHKPEKKPTKRVKRREKTIKPKSSKKIAHIQKEPLQSPLPDATKTSATPPHKVATSTKPTPPKPQNAQKVANYAKNFLQDNLTKIRQAIARHKFYPRLARKTRKEGEVVVEFTLAPHGMRDLRIIKPSPYKILDKAALRCIEKASAEFPKPRRRVDVRVPMEYRLR